MSKLIGVLGAAMLGLAAIALIGATGGGAIVALLAVLALAGVGRLLISFIKS